MDPIHSLGGLVLPVTILQSRATVIRLCRNDSDYLSASHLGMAKVDFQKTGIHSFQKSGRFNAV